MPRPLACAFALVMATMIPPAVASAARPAPQITAEFCVTCHNQNLVGSPAPNLVDALWTHGASDDAILDNIRRGFPQSGMQPFEGVLTEDEIRSVVAYIRSLAVEYAAGRIKHPTPPASVMVASELHSFTVDTYVPDLETPWGFVFLSADEMLVTEREGRLRIVRHGQLDPTPVAGIPAALVKQDGGLLDVIAHPDYAHNGWIYLAYTEAGAAPYVSMTVVVRGKIRDGRWVEQEDIFRAPPNRYYPGWIHYGCRFLFDAQRHLYFTIGDRGQPGDAQDLASPCGKIHRVFDDGRIPPDNPFAHTAGAYPSIWTFGNRHVQGLRFDPVTHKLWATEHGPAGGDELNRIEPGRNYGWPIISNGTDSRMKFALTREGMEAPVTSWTPSVAPSGIDFYTGDKFPRWKNHLFIGCLGGEQLKRVQTDGDRVVHEEIVFRGMGRVRAVTTGPDGLIYLLFNSPGRIARIVPDE